MHKSWQPVFNLSLWVVAGGGWLTSCTQIIPTSYKPSSPQIEQLAVDTSMTPKAQQLFYQQDPRIESKQMFHELCRNVEHNPEKTILLGCFTSNGYQGNIVLQSVTDPRLAGTMEVVAAHEMLHAAYQQLTAKERFRLAPQLKQAAQRVTETNLQAVLQEYAAGDPDIYVNELHSHLGTSLADLGNPELEEYYRQYFRDRQQVVTFAQQSRSVLSQIETQVQELEPELNALEGALKTEKNAIERTEDDLKASMQNLERMESNLTNLKQQTEAALSRGDTNLINQFEQERSRFNAAVQNFNGQVQTLQNRIDQFNQQFAAYSQKVDVYNQLAATNRSILSSIKLESSAVKAKPVSPPQGLRLNHL